MISAIQYLVDMVVTAVQMVIDFFTSLITSIGFLIQGIQYINSILYIIPGGLLIFAVAFLGIYLINRLTLGSNGGG